MIIARIAPPLWWRAWTHGTCRIARAVGKGGSKSHRADVRQDRCEQRFQPAMLAREAGARCPELPEW